MYWLTLGLKSPTLFQGNVPESMHSRILKPSGRGRKPNAHPNSAYGQYVASAANASQMNNYASMLSSQYVKMNMAAYAGLSGMAFNPAMYAATLANYGLIPGATTTKSATEEAEAKEDEDDLEEGEIRRDKGVVGGSAGTAQAAAAGAAAKSSAASPHPSFPVMYNPMLFMNNPLFAQTLGSYGLSPGIATPFASLSGANASLVNGTATAADSDTKDTPAKSDDEKENSQAEDLSVKSSMPTDLTVKKVDVSRGTSSASKVTVEPQTEPMDFSKKPATKKEEKPSILSKASPLELADKIRELTKKAKESKEKFLAMDKGQVVLESSSSSEVPLQTVEYVEEVPSSPVSECEVQEEIIAQENDDDNR